NSAKCPRYFQKLCRQLNGYCVQSTSKANITCECAENTVKSKSGVCTALQGVKNGVDKVRFLLGNNVQWSDDLEDKSSGDYLNLKSSALKFLKVVFPDAQPSIVGFTRLTSLQRGSTSPQIIMEALLPSEVSEYTQDNIYIALLAYQDPDTTLVNVPGIAFSVYSPELNTKHTTPSSTTITTTPSTKTPTTTESSTTTTSITTTVTTTPVTETTTLTTTPTTTSTATTTSSTTSVTMGPTTTTTTTTPSTTSTATTTPSTTSTTTTNPTTTSATTTPTS
ncbi:hypothetical protein QYM36_011784, partial [Artemia franciscana]